MLVLLSLPGVVSERHALQDFAHTQAICLVGMGRQSSISGSPAQTIRQLPGKLEAAGHAEAVAFLNLPVVCVAAQG